MKSFEESYLLKQQSRKRPKVNFDSSSHSSFYESECEDFKNIRKLSKIDIGLAVHMDKKYSYESASAEKDRSDLSDQSFQNDDGWLVANQKTIVSDGISNNGNDEGDDRDESSNNGNDEVGVGDESSNNGNDEEYVGDESSNNGNDERGDSDESSKHGTDAYSNSNKSDDDGSELNNSEDGDIHSILIPFESTNMEQEELNSDYNSFSDKRRLPYIEQFIANIRHQLKIHESMLKEIFQAAKETNKAVNDIKLSVQGLIRTVKDLAVQVFDSKAELKKRNGMFTDLLVPDIKLPIKRRNQYGDVALVLQEPKFVDNLVREYAIY